MGSLNSIVTLLWACCMTVTLGFTVIWYTQGMLPIISKTLGKAFIKPSMVTGISSCCSGEGTLALERAVAYSSKAGGVQCCLPLSCLGVTAVVCSCGRWWWYSSGSCVGSCLLGSWSQLVCTWSTLLEGCLMTGVMLWHVPWHNNDGH